MSTVEERNADKFRNRRKMAWQAWVFILVAGTSTLVAGITSDAMAARIEQFWPAVSTFIGTPGLIVLGYYGASAYEHTKDK